MKLLNVYPLLPFEPVLAKGSLLYDKEGKKYVDLYGGHAVISIGHQHPVWKKKISDQLEKIAFYSNSVLNSLQEELAEKLTKLSGYSIYQLFLCNSGAEANENALKLAAFKTGRKKVLAVKGAFHGRTSLVVACTDDPSIASSLNDHDVEFVEMNDETQLEILLNSGLFAAFIVEGIQGVAGIVEPSSSFLQKAAAFCKATGTVLLLDEVQSGVGRTGDFFAHQSSGIQADLITMAKGLGNGFPIGAVLVKNDFDVKYGMLGTTFGGNHLACSAALAVLEVMEEEGLQQKAIQKGNYLTQKLTEKFPYLKVSGKGLMLGIHFPFDTTPLRNSLFADHQVLVGSAKEKKVIRILPALNVEDVLLDQLVDALEVELKKEKYHGSVLIDG